MGSQGRRKKSRWKRAGWLCETRLMRGLGMRFEWEDVSICVNLCQGVPKGLGLSRMRRSYGFEKEIGEGDAPR